MKIEVSNGEIIDKLTIIEIKLEKISDNEKLINLKKEYEALNEAVKMIIEKSNPLYKKLYDTNCKLWDIEDRIRKLEKASDFDKEFIELARLVYFTNDQRSAVKKEINLSTGSNLIEEKSYVDYE